VYDYEDISVCICFVTLAVTTGDVKSLALKNVRMILNIKRNGRRLETLSG
jgi:hypothetical protein